MNPDSRGIEAGRPAPAGRRRWLAGVVAALGLWGCGEAASNDARPPEPMAPIQTSQEGLTCAPESIETGEWACTGQFTYSLECYTRRASTACGEDTTPKTCTTYGTCRHADFGQERIEKEVVQPRLGRSCESLAQSYLNATVPVAEDRVGVTWFWLIGGPPPTGGPVGGEHCYIFYANYPTGEFALGTGPQCALVESACTVACQNPKTCQVNGAWMTDATQCGTMVGPCGEGSGPKLYNSCRDATHGLAPDADCGAGFVEGQAPGGSTLAQVQAQAAAQWTASGGQGAPVYDAPVTCSECSRTFSLSEQELKRRIYAAIAMSRQQPKLNLLAGAAYTLARDNPALTQAELTAHLNTLATALGTYTFDPTTDGGGPMVHVMLRMLTKAEPTLPATSVPGRALRAHARAFLASMENGLDTPRGLGATSSQVERYAEATAFTEETWSKLYDLAQGNVALAGAVNSGGIGAGVGPHTDHSTQQMLDVNALGPLKGFVDAHLVNGRLVTTPDEARAFAAIVSTEGLDTAQAYSDMLNELNIAEQAYRAKLELKKPAGTTPAALAAVDASAEEQALKDAIATAKSRGTQLKDRLDGVRGGVTVGLGLLAQLFSLDGSSQLASDLVKLSKALDTTLEAVAKYAESSVKIAEKLTGVLGLGQKGFQIISATVFSGQLISAVFQLFSLLRKPAEPPIEQVILAEVRKLHDLVVQVQVRMLSRFERVDRKLQEIHSDMLARFALVDWNLGRVNQNVEEVQQSLYTLQANLNRIDQNMYAYFEDVKDDYFTRSTGEYLGWNQRHSVPMDYSEFVDAETDFFLWGADHAKTSTILAGVDGRGSNAAISPVDELTVRALTHNINYLREFPFQMGQPMLRIGDRLSSPKDWMAGAEAYARLFEEQPVHGAAMLSTRHGPLITAGTQLDTALTGMGKPLFTALHTRYLAHWGALKTAIEDARVEWRNNPNGPLYGVDPWGAPEQAPTTHFLKQGEKPVAPCAGGQWGDYNGDNTPDTPHLNPAPWNHDVLGPFLIADNMNVGAATIDLCGEGSWQLYSEVPTGLGGTYERKYRLQSKVYVRFTYLDTDTNTVKSEKIYSYLFTGGQEFTIVIRGVDRPTYDPNNTENPQEWMAKRWDTVKASITPTRGPLPSTLLTSLRPKVIQALRSQQPPFYASIAQRMEQGGDPLQVQAKQLTGTWLVWQSYVALALPLSVDHDENLHGLLYGDDSVLSGHDTLLNPEVAPVMNDVQDMYALFGQTDDPPADNLLTLLDTTVTSRAERLKAAVEASLDAQATSGGPEATAWTEATLLRLRLSMPQ
ncbi:hypothetical protein JYK02_27165 [Corallococcus macrosporus]|uniref:Uncharacterized protein n=1 Tax=Corallococcus macrosporus TaxID=35 RepID=A0ABS3DIP3_9BACT|nr:hypothetical protein [Corallococcus macrosporus]MBN8231206.1 hypothetical protein [Corallococcus macrosporus]